MSIKRPFLKAFELAAKHRRDRFPDGLPLKAKKSSDTAGDLWIYDVIGVDWWTGEGITGKSVADQLGELKGVKTLNVYINSPGGDVFEAKAILTNLQRFDAEKVVHVDGVAASAATYIAMAGDRIITAKHANWMVHEASALAYGRAEDMRAMADLLDLQNKDLAEAYAKQTGGTVDEMLALMADETWMDSAKALELGFTDEIAPEPEPKEDAAATAKVLAQPLVQAALSTEQRVQLARQQRRLEQLSNRASPASRSGQPPRPTP